MNQNQHASQFIINLNYGLRKLHISNKIGIMQLKHRGKSRICRREDFRDALAEPPGEIWKDE